MRPAAAAASASGEVGTIAPTSSISPASSASPVPMWRPEVIISSPVDGMRIKGGDTVVLTAEIIDRQPGHAVVVGSIMGRHSGTQAGPVLAEDAGVLLGDSSGAVAVAGAVTSTDTGVFTRS